MGRTARENVAKVVVIRLIGSFDSPEDQSRIVAAVKEAVEDKPAGVLVNYEEVTRMTSGNYGVFLPAAVAAYKLGKTSGVPVKHLIPTDSDAVGWLHEHLQITRLDRLISAFGNEAEALRSFGPPP
jgi:hypothetical protein